MSNRGAGVGVDLWVRSFGGLVERDHAEASTKTVPSVLVKANGLTTDISWARIGKFLSTEAKESGREPKEN